MSADRPGDIGSKLRAARERKGVTLREIANRTKIAVAALEALERNDISRLPGGIFSRAFVRSYAHEVGLDPEATIQEFITQFPQDSVTAGHPRSDPVEDTELFESERRVASSVLWMALVSTALAGGVMYLSMARGRVEDVPAPEPMPTPAAEPAAAIKPPGEPAAAVGRVAAPPEPRATSGSTPAAPAVSAAPAPSEDRFTIVLSARRPVWISATVDGQKAIGRLLQSGEQETVDVRREMVITAGDAGAVRMMINGSEARALGKTGEVVTARVGVSNFKDYLQNR
jgi:cytoskeleton protein RodZ